MNLSNNNEIRKLLQGYMHDTDAEAVLSGLDALIQRKKIDIQSVTDTKKAIDRINTLRIPGTFIYVSLEQLKENIIKGLPGLFLRFGFQPDKMKENAIIHILPQAIASVHLIRPKERCIFIEAIEFYLRDGAFHPIQDFVPKLLTDSACDNLDVACDHRNGDFCRITNGKVATALDTLSKKHILERNINNEYRYCKW